MMICIMRIARSHEVWALGCGSPAHLLPHHSHQDHSPRLVFGPSELATPGAKDAPQNSVSFLSFDPRRGLSDDDSLRRTKRRTVLVKLVSTAGKLSLSPLVLLRDAYFTHIHWLAIFKSIGTGFFYTTSKVRTAERKIARMKYDPRGLSSSSHPSLPFCRV